MFYSLYCDPLWSVVGALSWTIPFAVVAFGPLWPKMVLARCAVLVACLALLLVSGMLEYAYTLLRYTGRV